MSEESFRLADRLGLRPGEAARVLGISERKLRGILPELPHIRFGTAVVIPVASLQEWLRQRAEVHRATTSGRRDRLADEELRALGLVVDD